jgi:hypothetical protein
MKPLRLFCLLVMGLTTAFVANAAPLGAPASPVVIKELLLDFLTNNTDPARHEKFWADDVIYTSALGMVRTKPEIMVNARQTAAKVRRPPLSEAAPPVYTAEDINIRPYNGFAALTFRLVVKKTDGTVETYRNSGTLIFRDGRWQVITWQATQVPPAAQGWRKTSGWVSPDSSDSASVERAKPNTSG